MNVLVTGGNGFIGRHLCAELVERGHEVTSLSRSPDPEGVPDGAETTIGDVTAYDSIEGAFEGKDAIVNLVALSPLFEPKGGNELHDVIHRGGTENCVQAAEEQDVDRFVQLSALGADPDGDTHYIRAKGLAEEIVQESALDWTIFRPSVVFGEGAEFLSFTRKLTPPVVAPFPGGGKTRFQPIHIDDLVEMLAASLESDDHVGEVYEIGGPEQLTLADVARQLGTADGKSVHILPVPMPLAGIGLTVAGAVPGFPMGRDQYKSLKFDNVTADNDIDAFDLTAADLTTLSGFLEADTAADA